MFRKVASSAVLAVLLGCGGPLQPRPSWPAQQPTAGCNIAVSGQYNEQLVCNIGLWQGPGALPFQWSVIGYLPGAPDNEIVTIRVNQADRPTLGTAYGFSGASSNVVSTDLLHWANFSSDPVTGLGSAALTHEASTDRPPGLGGSFSVVFTEISAPGASKVLHGTAEAVLEGNEVFGSQVTGTGPLAVTLAF